MNSLHHFIPFKRNPLEHQWTCCFLGLFMATGDQFKFGLIDLLLAMDGHLFLLSQVLHGTQEIFLIGLKHLMRELKQTSNP